MSRAPLAVLFVSALLASACRTPVFEPRAMTAADPRPAKLLAALEDEAASRRGLRASAKLSLEAPDLRLRRPQRMALQRPASLRVEILGLFHQVAAVLVTDGLQQQRQGIANGRIIVDHKDERF